MTAAKSKRSAEEVVKYADMFTAMGTEPRLRIMQLLLSAHPEGLVVGEMQSELGIPNSTLSHHLEKLKNENLVRVRRVPSSGTRPTPRLLKSCWASFTPSAAPATKRLNLMQLSPFATSLLSQK
jgi:DNA-binding transcriptional ArsR family regulator